MRESSEFEASSATDVSIPARPAFRLPAEWEPQVCVWVSRPHNPDTWPGCLKEAIRQFNEFVAKLQEHVEVCDTQRLGITTDDSWIRDYGPTFVTQANGGWRAAFESKESQSVPSMDPRLATRNSRLPFLVAHDFRFNSWGGKYLPWDRDDAAAGALAKRLGIPVRRHHQVLEGGAIDGNGEGAILTTQEGVLGPGRNPEFDRSQVEHLLRETLGATRIIWLSGGICGDDTGHIDQVARFINSRTVAAVRVPPGHADHELCERNWRLLKETRDQDGKKFDLITLPAPWPLSHCYPPSPSYDVCRGQLPASYANFLISNGAVFVPVFGRPSDDDAVRVLEQALPDHKIVPVRSEHLLVGLGTIHCLTLQQPACRQERRKHEKR